MNTTLIIYAYNSESALKQTLSHHTTLFNQIIIIDDHSQDETITYITTHFTQCRLIKNPYFMGYAASINAAVNIALTKWVIISHADTQLYTPISFTPLDNVVALLPFCSKRLFSFRTCQRSCSVAGKLSQAIAIHRDKFNHLGGIDLLYYPGGYEWADFLYLAIQRGWKVEQDPNWKVKTSIELIGYWYQDKLPQRILTIRNKLLFTWKTTDHFYYWGIHIISIIMAIFMFRIQFFRGMVHALRRLPEIVNSRKNRLPLLSLK